MESNDYCCYLGIEAAGSVPTPMPARSWSRIPSE